MREEVTDIYSDHDRQLRRQALDRAAAERRAEQQAWLDAVLPEVMKEINSSRVKKEFQHGENATHVVVRLPRKLGNQLYRNRADRIELRQMLAVAVNQRTGFEVLNLFPYEIEYHTPILFGKRGWLKFWLSFYPE